MPSVTTEYSHAFAVRNKIAEHFRMFVESDGKDSQAEKDVMNSVVPGLYEHWKSIEGEPKFYVVHSVGIEKDVQRPLVAYAALYPPRVGVMTFLHLLDEQNGFLTPVERGGWSGARFRLIVPLSRKNIDVLLQYAGELAVIKGLVQFRLHASALVKKNIPLF